jgi:glycosyltransferase involved in cell wall biosynthesis
MDDFPLISICIPAYKRADFLKRLLDSIRVQHYRNFEVIITDDSPDGQVQSLAAEYQDLPSLRYFRNPAALGTPENWNESIRQAKGGWIKIMHDDDWFADPGSLQVFAGSIQPAPGSPFIFCAYANHYLETGRIENVFVPPFRYARLRSSPASLLSSNIIGPPSVVLHRKNDLVLYDPQIRWLVDIDFYIRYLKTAQPVYISQVLVNVGIGRDQVTADCFGNKYVEIPENFHLLQKTGAGTLRNIMVYDAWWRLLRNLDIRSEADIRKAGYAGVIPAVIRSMVRWQKKIPGRLLGAGIFSKPSMLLHYICNYAKISN